MALQMEDHANVGAYWICLSARNGGTNHAGFRFITVVCYRNTRTFLSDRLTMPGL